MVLSILIAICLISEARLHMVPPASPLQLSWVQPVENNDQRKAKRLWEQAITAKGGRERLYAVHNLVISTKKEPAGVTQVRREELIVLPNKYWFWDDYRPSKFGLRVSMYDYDSNLTYAISDVEPNHPAEPIKNMQRNKALRNAQLSLLLETKWLKPTLIKATTGMVGLRPVDIVQTTVGGERVDFVFDRKTHLPVRVSYYDVFEGKTYVNIESFSNYTEVNGIKVPMTQKYNDGSKYKARFQFNVEYNPDIFVKPPPIEAGPEAWKRQR